MDKESAGLRWGVERRLEFIEFRLYWEGGINRSDIREFFGVSVPQASKDLSLYQEMAPHNLAYDKSNKIYLAANNFEPKFLKPDPDQYLQQLRHVAEDGVPVDETWLASAPSHDCMPIPHRRVKPEVLRTIVDAIRTGKSLNIEYHSMNPHRSGPQWRGISPHAIAHDGFRWHVRAFCHIDQVFKDFVLSRCVDCKKSGPPEASGKDDFLWHEIFDVELMPNPNLTEAKQEIIAYDYEMLGMRLTLHIRKALLYYFQKWLRLDIEDPLSKPDAAPIVIANVKAFDKALTETMGR